MRLWRLVRADHVALDGAGALEHGGRYSLPGKPVVNFASEAGLAVLIALRYLSRDLSDSPDDFLLGWTESGAAPERVPEDLDEPAIREWMGEWLASNRSLLVALPSRVLPEALVVMMNPRHPDAATIPPLEVRAFSFAECLHRPPMLDVYGRTR